MFSRSCWRFLSFPASGLPPWEIRKKKLTDEVQLKYIGITFKNLLIQTVDFLSDTNVPIESLAKNMNTWLFDHKNREKSVTPGTLLLKEWRASFVTLVNGDICQVFFFFSFFFSRDYKLFTSSPLFRNRYNSPSACASLSTDTDQCLKPKIENWTLFRSFVLFLKCFVFLTHQ